jgi:hypothetical protein
MVEEVNSCMIYLIHCKNLCKCHNVPAHIKTIKEKNDKLAISKLSRNNSNLSNHKDIIIKNKLNQGVET